MTGTIETQRANLFGALEKLAQAVGADPGGMAGASSHPTASADGNVQPASEGARSSENTKDVKEQVGSPSVDSSSDASYGGQNDVQLNVGTNQTGPGEDPAVEDAYTNTFKDPGSSHPARTDNAAIGGNGKQASAAELLDQFSALANDVLAGIAAGGPQALSKAAVAAAMSNSSAASPQADLSAAIEKAAAAAADTTPAAEDDTAYADGYKLAAAMGLTQKQAAAEVEATVNNLLTAADEDADLVIGYFDSFQKAAAGPGFDMDAGSGEDEPASNPDAEGDAAGSAAGPPAAGGGPAAGTPAADPAAAGGGGLEALLGGGGPPPAPAEGAGAEVDPAIMQQVVAALDELGIPVEELAQAGGGEPAAPGMKLAKAVTRFKRAGLYRATPAADGSAERAARDRYKQLIMELTK